MGEVLRFGAPVAAHAASGPEWNTGPCAVLKNGELLAWLGTSVCIRRHKPSQNACDSDHSRGLPVIAVTKSAGNVMSDTKWLSANREQRLRQVLMGRFCWATERKPRGPGDRVSSRVRHRLRMARGWGSLRGFSGAAPLGRAAVAAGGGASREPRSTIFWMGGFVDPVICGSS